MRYLKYKITTALVLGIVIATFGQRYQHQGQTSSYGGGVSEGVGLKSFIVAGEPIIGPFSGGTYTGNAGFMFASSDCEAPMDVAVDNIATTTATLNWSAVAGADKYEVRYRLQGNIPWTTEEALTNTLDLTVLETGMAYQFQVRTVCVADGSRKSIWTELYEFETLGLATCEVPQNVTGVPTILGEADIAWDAANGATEYEVRWKLSNNTEWLNQTNVTAPYTITSLQPGAEYAVQVRTICSGGLVSPWSSSVLFLSGGDPECNTPSNVAASNITLNGAQVSWTNLTEAINGYEVRYRVSSSANWTQAAVASSPYDISGLAQGMEYIVLVRSLCDNSLASSFSTEVVFTTAGVPVCNPVTGIAIDSNTDDGSTATVDLSWPVDPNGLGYDIRYRIKGSVTYTTFQSGNNQATLDGLYTGIEYQASVRKICTFNGSLTSAWSEPFFFITSGPSSCEVPTGLDAVPDEINIDEVTLSWTDVTTTYENFLVQYKVKGSSVSNDVTAANANPLLLTGLAPGMIYQYRVRTICDSGLSLKSAWSPYFEFSMFGTPNCQSPVNLVLVSANETSATLSWDAAANAVGYGFRYQTGTSVSLGEVGTNSVTLNNLAPGTGYIFNVRSKCAADGSIVSNYSPGFIFSTTGVATCVKPANLVLGSATETSLNLNWDDAAGSIGYEVKFKPSTGAVFSTIVASNSEIVLSSLFSGTSYNIEIRNLCSSGVKSLPVIANFSTAGTSACEVPTGLSVAGITETGATVSWIGANNANTTGYYIRWKKVSANIWNSQYFGGWTNSHSLSGLTSGTQYVFQVSRTCLGNVTSEVSAPVYFTTSGSVPCGSPPTNLVVSSLTSTTATVSWDGVDLSSDGYHVQLRPDGQLTWIEGYFPWSNQHDMTPLTPGTNYTFRVSRVCNYPNPDSESEYAIIRFTTPANLSPRIGSNITREANVENVTGLNVYPNPFSDQLSIEFVLEESQFMQIDLLTLNGQVIETILKGETSSGSYRFNAEINDMAEGTYLLRFSSDLDTPVYKRIVKQ